mmetsp:Transcript_28172/g.59648  ORF Transcript_28172/g.59648 Transcript_28172/m.59648 type:complete len:215 (+) Transcript_28172:315-959(+)
MPEAPGVLMATLRSPCPQAVPVAQVAPAEPRLETVSCSEPGHSPEPRMWLPCPLTHRHRGVAQRPWMRRRTERRGGEPLSDKRRGNHRGGSACFPPKPSSSLRSGDPLSLRAPDVDPRPPFCPSSAAARPRRYFAEKLGVPLKGGGSLPKGSRFWMPLAGDMPARRRWFPASAPRGFARALLWRLQIPGSVSPGRPDARHKRTQPGSASRCEAY